MGTTPFAVWNRSTPSMPSSASSSARTMVPVTSTVVAMVSTCAPASAFFGNFTMSGARSTSSRSGGAGANGIPGGSPTATSPMKTMSASS
jgi:hypothetical protein